MALGGGPCCVCGKLTGPKQGIPLGTISEGHPVISIKSIRASGLALECTLLHTTAGQEAVSDVGRPFFNGTGKSREIFPLLFRGSCMEVHHQNTESEYTGEG